MRTKCFFRQLEANVTTRRFELDEQNNFRSEALFLLFRSSIFYSLSLSLSLARSKPRNCSRSNDIKPARNYFCPDPLKRFVSPREWRPEWCFQFVYLITHNCFTYTASRADASSRSRNLFSFFRLIFSPFFRHLLRSSLRFRFAFSLCSLS